MHRIRVVGNSGSGKTRLARDLAERLQLPHLELDALQHLAGWEPAGPDHFNSRLEAFVADSEESGGWVIDGNYNDRTPQLFDAADAIVWLDYPRHVVMARLLRRTFARILLRRELWNGNRERLRTLRSRDPDVNVVLWAWTQHAQCRRRYSAAMQRSPARWVRLSSPRHTRSWLRNIRSRRLAG